MNDTRCAQCENETCECDADALAAPSLLLHSSTFEELWASLSNSQRLYVLARQKHARKTDAAESIGIDRTTIYRWGPEVEACVEALQLDAARAAVHVLQQGLAQAAAAKIEGLDARDERVRQLAASDILDRFLGSARQTVSVQHSGKVETTPVQVYLPANTRDVSDIVDATFEDDE